MEHHHHRREERISLLVPFRSDDGERDLVWRWLRRYWVWEMPSAEIVMGTDNGQIFSKSAAVNDAAKRANGDIFAILDADAYLYGHQIETAARHIREAKLEGRNLWYIPYRRLWRLTRRASLAVRESDPRFPARIPVPPPPYLVEGAHGSAHGHWFGAMCQVMPREAFWTVNGMDERFRGWGGEDSSLVRAVDTMWGRHKTIPGAVFHLWHARQGTDHFRQWAGQPEGEQANSTLSSRYGEAYGDRARMRALIAESME